MTLYPCFHPERPRFFNLLALFFEIFSIMSARDIYHSSDHISGIDIAYKMYKGWLKKGNQELILPGFKMNSRQMFWLTAAHIITNKYQIGVSQNFKLANQLTNKYMHVLFKNKKQFRKDFKCNKISVNEARLYKEFLLKKKFVMKVIELRDLVGGRKFDFGGIHFCMFYRLRVEGFYDFIESVLKDPKYADDVEEMRRKEGQGNNNMARILLHVCPSVEGCRFLI